jgi:PAS domain S-box-containing protein
MKNKPGLLNSIKTLGRKLSSLIYPAYSIADIPTRRQVIFSAMMSFSLLLVILVGLVANILVRGITHITSIVLAGLSITLFLAYLLSRLSSFRAIGPILLTFSLSISAFVVAYFYPNHEVRFVSGAIFTFIPLALVLGSALLPWWGNVVLMAANSAVVMLLPSIIPTYPLDQAGADAGAILSMGVLLIGVMTYRNRTEHIRLEEIQGINRQLQQVNHELETTRADLENERTLLRSNETRIRALLAAIPDLVFELSREGVFLDFVPTTMLKPMIPPGHFLGQNVSDVMPPEVALKTLISVQQVLSNGQMQTFEYQLPTAGVTHYFEARMVTSRPDAVLAIVRDITDRAQAEEALRESESRFRGFIEETSDGIMFFDNRGKVVEWNNGMERLTGLDRQRALEMQAFDVQMKLTPSEEIAETDIEKLKLFFQQVFEIGDLPNQNQSIREITAQHLDGSLRVAEQRLFLVDTAHGFALGAVFHDITERKKAEQQMQQHIDEMAVIHAVGQAAASQLELDALFDLIAQELMRLFDIQEVYFALCDQKTEMVQFPYYRHGDQRLEPDPVPLGQGLSSKVILSRQPLLINQDYERRSAELGVVRYSPFPGTISKVSWLGVPIQAGEQVIGVICMQNLERENVFTEADVRLLTTIAMNVGIAIQNAQLYTAVQQELAERKQVEMERENLIVELEGRNAELERFAYTVSHELKAPLVTIRGFLGFLEKDMLAGNLERLKADMSRITEATDKMQGLLRELLELSRIGRLMNPPEDVPSDDIVRDAIELVSGRLDARNIQVIVADDLPVVHGDRARLVEVVQNLVDNAAKFMGDQSQPKIEIGFHVDKQNGAPIFFVRDNGIGIEAQYHERIFGLFNKLDAQSEGTGVGLALVKRIVEVHGGRIWVESEPGKGSTFFFSIA